jgi:iron complex outermembrane receptor protein
MPKNPILLRRLALSSLLFVLGLATALGAEAGRAGAIAGRVRNADTGEFLYNAQIRAEAGAWAATTATDQFGAYRFDGVPGGEATLRVVYSGLPAAVRKVGVSPGQDTAADLALGGAEAATKMDAFQVNVSRQMGALDLAVNSQRYSNNIKSVISVDQMGFIGDGNVASALKFLPGIDLEVDVNGMANSVTMSGAPSANVPVTFGGFEVTTSADATVASSTAPQRTASLTQLSLNNISRVEINRSALPDDPGSALAGSINFVPKSAFELSRPQYTLQAFGAVLQDKIASTRMFGPFSSRIPSYQPGLVLGAIVPVNDRFGFSVTVSHNQAPHAYQQTVMGWKSNYRAATNSYAPTPANPDHYMLNTFEVDNFLATTERSSINLTADYKLSKAATFSVSYTQGFSKMQQGQRQLTWGNTEWQNPNTSTLTTIYNIVPPNSQVRILNNTYTYQVDTANRQLTLDFRYRAGPWRVEAGASYGTARKQNRDADVDATFSTLYNLRPLSNMTFRDIQPWGVGEITSDLNGVKVTPLDMTTFVSAGNFAASISAQGPAASPTPGYNIITNLPPLRFKPVWTDDEKTEFKGSASRDVRLTVPTVVKVGYKVLDYKRNVRLSRWGNNGAGFIYKGTRPLSDFLLRSYDEPLPNGKGVPIGVDNVALAKLFRSNPQDFVEANPGSNYQSMVQNNKKFHETIAAAFLRLDHDFLGDRLHLAYGVRFEQTYEKGRGGLYDPAGNYQRNAAGQFIDAAGRPVAPGTRPALIWTSGSLGEAVARYIDYAAVAKVNYGNYFPSANLSYNLTPTWVTRLSFSTTIGRPDLTNIYPGINLPDPAVIPTATTTSTYITAQNPGIKPWSSRNVALSLEYYSPRGLGTVALRAYRRFVSDAFTNKVLAPKEAQDVLNYYGVDPTDYPDSYVSTLQTIPGQIVTSGLELSGNVKLDSFLPPFASGLQLNFSASRSTMTGGGDAALAFAARNLYLVPYSVGGGLALNKRRFSVSVTGKWNSQQRLGYIDYLSTNTVDPGTYEYLAPVLRVDADAALHLTTGISLFVNGRNVNNVESIQQRYSPATPELAKNLRRQAYQPVWTAGVKAKF